MGTITSLRLSLLDESHSLVVSVASKEERLVIGRSLPFCF
jgi:hypothetical protein